MQKQEEITTRLKKIFDLFLRDNFSTTDSVYFEKLITHLQAKGKFIYARMCACVQQAGGTSNTAFVFVFR